MRAPRPRSFRAAEVSGGCGGLPRRRPSKIRYRAGSTSSVSRLLEIRPPMTLCFKKGGSRRLVSRARSSGVSVHTVQCGSNPAVHGQSDGTPVGQLPHSTEHRAWRRPIPDLGSRVCSEVPTPVDSSQVMSPILQRMTAWLCLALFLLTGAAPAQGFVLCIEADGCVRVEVKSSTGDCGSCDSHDSSSLPSQAPTTPTRDAGCPCIDIAVPGSPQGKRVPPRPVEFESGPCITPPLALFSQPLVSVAVALGATRSQSPRPPESLAHIRTVVLLV